jgi:hypothetical protein
MPDDFVAFVSEDDISHRSVRVNGIWVIRLTAGKLVTGNGNNRKL